MSPRAAWSNFEPQSAEDKELAAKLKQATKEILNKNSRPSKKGSLHPPKKKKPK